MIGGFVARGFEPVRQVFERNLASGRELGAACAAYVRGEKVLDLWGGIRDARSGARWDEDTLVLVYSTSKGLAAMTLAMLHSRGHLDYDERVATYWPEFAQNGKEKVTVRQLLGHEAGLPVIDERLTPELIADFDRLAEVIARQRPMWEPGTRHGYHGISIGWYMGELVRRVDPQHRTLGTFFAEEIAGPLELDVYFGVARDLPKRRIARIERANLRALPGLRDMPPRMALAMANPRSVTFKAFANPRVYDPAAFDSRHYRHIEFPAGGALGTARSVARAYSAFAVRKPELGLTLETMAELTAPARPPTRGWHDEVLKVDTAFSLGFARPKGELDFGFSTRALGHPGAGGSFAFADPEGEVSFAYVMNRMGFHVANDPREKSLRDALLSCLNREARAA